MKPHTWTTLTCLSELSDKDRTYLFQFSNNPFNCYEFLSALESTGCVGEQSGWLPHHQLLTIEGQAVGLLICYQKQHSYGEYVFDWAWAEAYHRHNIPYYPKLLVAIPFTPVPVSKWLTSADITEELAVTALLERDGSYVSGVHYLYPPEQQPSWHEEQWINRHGQQFHWFNEHPVDGREFQDFDDFLKSMTARKRKSIKKERAAIHQKGIRCVWRTGHEISGQELNAFYQYYHLTYFKRGHKGYLSREFFEAIFDNMPDAVRLLVCYQDSDIVAAALYFVSDDTLYGRYWGSNHQHELLHFEACYYQGIDYCLTHKLKCFNPGTQGEHKISRGFKPTLTMSYHHLTLPPFQQAIGRFCREEKLYNQEYMQSCSVRLPFKKLVPD